jgi:hypothetical protein
MMDGHSLPFQMMVRRDRKQVQLKFLGYDHKVEEPTKDDVQSVEKARTGWDLLCQV